MEQFPIWTLAFRDGQIEAQSGKTNSGSVFWVLDIGHWAFDIVVGSQQTANSCVAKTRMSNSERRKRQAKQRFNYMHS
jgi:hypothetical protein